MPAYDYRCDACEVTQEITKKIAESDRTENCEQCQQAMRKLIHSTSFQLKGGGWASSGYSHAHVSFKNKKTGATTTVPYKKGIGE